MLAGGISLGRQPHALRVVYWLSLLKVFNKLPLPTVFLLGTVKACEGIFVTQWACFLHRTITRSSSREVCPSMWRMWFDGGGSCSKSHFQFHPPAAEVEGRGRSGDVVSGML